MTKKEFLADVKHEVEMLKKHTTDLEKSKLNFDIYYEDATKCIYGKLTGDCESLRAKELISACCIKTFSNLNDGAADLEDLTFSEVEKLINGVPEVDIMFTNVDGRNRNYSYLSSLEGYICLKGAKVRNVVNYLKGKTDDLIL